MSNRHVQRIDQRLPSRRNSAVVEPMGFPTASRTFVFVPSTRRVVAVAGVGTNNNRANNNANRWRARA
jgi:hypothetical protein